jgi:hypothetical protein
LSNATRTQLRSSRLYVDGANPSFIKSLKLQIGEDPDYDKVIARYKSEGLGDANAKDMRIVPVNFNKEHKAMLGHCKMILEKMVVALQLIQTSLTN